MVSSSIRCYFKTLNGGRNQPAKLLWNMLEKMSKEKETLRSKVFREEDISELINPLQVALILGGTEEFEEGGLKSLVADLQKNLVLGSAIYSTIRTLSSTF